MSKTPASFTQIYASKVNFCYLMENRQDKKLSSASVLPEKHICNTRNDENLQIVHSTIKKILPNKNYILSDNIPPRNRQRHIDFI